MLSSYTLILNSMLRCIDCQVLKSSGGSLCQENWLTVSSQQVVDELDHHDINDYAGDAAGEYQ